MRRIVLILIAAVMSAVMLTGCGENITPAAGEIKRVKAEEILPKKAEPPSGSTQKTFEQIKLTLPDRWREKKTDSGTWYIDDETHCAYQFAGMGDDEWLEPEDIISQYMSKRAVTPQLVMPLSKTMKDKNGVKYQTAAIKYRNEKNNKVMLFFFSPDNRLFWIFSGETTERAHFTALLDSLKEVAKTVEFDLLVKDEDVITGHTVKVSGLDNYIFEFGTNGHFLKYNKAKEKTKVCTSGTYKLYRGKEAIKYVLSRDEGFNEKEITDRIKKECRTYNDYYVVVLQVDEIWDHGTQMNSKSYEWMFCGTLLSGGKMAMKDYLQYIEITWTPKK